VAVAVSLREETQDGWRFEVSVSEEAGQTVHEVSLRRDLYRRLVGDAWTPEVLVQRSFEFLLEREPASSILRQFDLSVISRYFPEYEAEIRRQAGA
jgi:hypothetical protein